MSREDRTLVTSGGKDAQHGVAQMARKCLSGAENAPQNGVVEHLQTAREQTTCPSSPCKAPLSHHSRTPAGRRDPEKGESCSCSMQRDSAL